MTKRFFAETKCPTCGTIMSAESPFSQWLRGNERLSSEERYVCSDLDYVWMHRRVTNDKIGQREVLHLLVLEVKTQAAKPSLSQRDALSVVSQLIANYTNKTIKRKADGSRSGRSVVLVDSKFAGRKIPCKVHGAFLLQFQNYSPTDGRMWWDYQEIDTETLTGLLRFDIHPVTLKKWNIDRRHHTNGGQMALWEEP